MTTQIAVRLPDALIAEVDDLVAETELTSRTEAVRVALELYLSVARRRAIDDALVRGYAAHPPGGADEWGATGASADESRRALEALDREDGGW
jgi:Arc/MetJ-type ribon-helix-helix transcriptional regulator